LLLAGSLGLGGAWAMALLEPTAAAAWLAGLLALSLGGMVFRRLLLPSSEEEEVLLLSFSAWIGDRPWAEASAFLLSLFPLLALGFASLAPGYSLPSLLLAWSFVLSGARRFAPLAEAAGFWQAYGMFGALLALLGLPTPYHWQAVAVLAALGGLSLLQPGQTWRWNSLILPWAALHLAWPTLLPDTPANAMLAWLALQNILLAWALRGLKWPAASNILAGIGGLLWLAHGINAAQNLATLPGGHLAAIAGGLLLALLCWRMLDSEDWKIYGAAFFLGLSGLYLRLFWIGLQPPMPGDTVAVLAASYALMSAHYFTRSPALYRLALLLPVLALFIVPWQLGSVHASLALLASAGIYLSRAGASRILGLLALNAGM
jgi:hypothetical protein